MINMKPFEDLNWEEWEDCQMVRFFEERFTDSIREYLKD